MRRILIACFSLALAGGCVAQEHEHGALQHPGEKLGTVHFATSCDQKAQPDFDRAVALLHSFQFRRAIDGFNAVMKTDPECGIAWWGIALSQWSNPFAAGLKDKSQLEAGRASAEKAKSTGAKTERERDYIAAVAALYRDFENTGQRARLLAYRDAMEGVATKYPDDHEAQAFYALSIAASEDPADKTYAGRLKAGAILEKLFAEEPNHPGLAHYIIHNYDVPPLAARAVPAAQRYADIAPDAPHALHMPSHTFTRTGYWQDSIRANMASAAAAKRGGEAAEELHATDYEIYAYLQTAQDKEAQSILNSLPEIASRVNPKALIAGAAPPLAAYFALAAIPARYALERSDWQQAAQLTVRETAYPYTDAITWFARGLGSARLGQAKPAYESAEALHKLGEKLGQSGEKYWALQVHIQEAETRAWATFAEGKKKEALDQMEAAAKLEDGTEKSAVTPGPLAPARELLGEMLLAAGRPAPALAEFEATLKKEPGRFRALYGAARAAQLAGQPEVSRKYYGELVKVCAQGDHPGRKELAEARKTVAQK